MTTLQASLDAADRPVARPLAGTLSLRFDGQDLSRRREPRYRGPWRLPGPDLHRLAAVSLSLGVRLVHHLLSLLAPELLGAQSHRCHSPRENGPESSVLEERSAGLVAPLQKLLLTRRFEDAVPSTSLRPATHRSARPLSEAQGARRPLLERPSLPRDHE